ncbi:MAG: hypothetical protein ACOYOF_14945 [Verrucomicrobiaceae bacterium]|jgi:hypothetical protein
MIHLNPFLFLRWQSRILVHLAVTALFTSSLAAGDLDVAVYSFPPTVPGGKKREQIVITNKSVEKQTCEHINYVIAENGFEQDTNKVSWAGVTFLDAILNPGEAVVIERECSPSEMHIVSITIDDHKEIVPKHYRVDRFMASK